MYIDTVTPNIRFYGTARRVKREHDTVNLRLEDSPPLAPLSPLSFFLNRACNTPQNQQQHHKKKHKAERAAEQVPKHIQIPQEFVLRSSRRLAATAGLC